ncbi:Tetraspanin-18 [Branchiostoma belcheri]|nr:Tetraspanin-18 [Branchiostoma belcheri]
MRGVKEAVYIRAHQPSLNCDGGRFRLPATCDALLTSSRFRLPENQRVHHTSDKSWSKNQLHDLTKLSGAALLGVGIWVIVAQQSFITLVGDNPLFITGAYILIGVGAFVFFVGFLGCCGAIKESKCMLILFFILLLLIFAAEIVAAVLAFMFRAKTEQVLSDMMNKTLQEDYKGPKAQDPTSAAWNYVQIIFGCCGTTGYQDWLTSNWVQNQGQGTRMNFPSSCCVRDKASLDNKPTNETACFADPTNSAYMNADGCFEKMKSEFQEKILIIAIVGIAIAAVMILGMVFSICMVRNMEEK